MNYYETMERIRIGISSCLLGRSVRYDGGHKHEGFITETLGPYCEFIPVCPEVECGLPVPREAMRLVGSRGNPRLVTLFTGIDHTDRMLEWARGRLDRLAAEDIIAFIFKTKSPSSGLRGVRIYKEDGNVLSRAGRGIFAAEFTRRFQDIPVEDDGRLRDPVLRENFVETIFTLQRWREGPRNGGAGDLVAFHSRHKYALMAHSPEDLRALGRIAASPTDRPFDETLAEYRAVLGRAMAKKKTRRKNHNVLLHLAGYFKKNLEHREKLELLDAVDRYRNGIVPLIVPLTLINHYVMKYSQEYLAGQTFLNPHPAELGLLNHV